MLGRCCQSRAQRVCTRSLVTSRGGGAQMDLVRDKVWKGKGVRKESQLVAYVSRSPTSGRSLGHVGLCHM